MKLRNKKTGTIGRLHISGNSFLITEDNEANRLLTEYISLSSLLKEWEDYEELKDNDYWYIEPDGSIIQCHKPSYINHLLDGLKSIDNYFETREEAEKAVEKLRAWKRLKDKGFRSFSSNICGDDFVVTFKLTNHADYGQSMDDFDCIFDFGGEE